VSQQLPKFFHDVFHPGLPRLGPGDDASTLKAINLVLAAGLRPRSSSPAGLRILDLGCGNGAQTMQLAKNLDGTILAVDNYQPYLDELQRRAQAQGVSEKIQVRLGDMGDLDFEEGSFDLIWSEGALYGMGFGHGLAVCHRLLKPGGMLAVSELCWLRPDPPAECREYLAGVYPAIADLPANLAAMRGCGYEILGHFSLPESSWWTPLYRPLEARLQTLREKWPPDPQRLEIIESVQTEIEVYRRFSGYYGYVLYVLQRG